MFHARDETISSSISPMYLIPISFIEDSFPKEKDSLPKEHLEPMVAGKRFELGTILCVCEPVDITGSLYFLALTPEDASSTTNVSLSKGAIQ